MLCLKLRNETTYLQLTQKMKHFFLFDKWGLPIKKQGIEQPESIKKEY
jgi:hypothetical protein